MSANQFMKREVQDCLIQDLFIEQAKRTPDNLAIISSSRQLSYKSLFVESQYWGEKLRNFAKEPNTLIAVVMEKGWEQIVAVLGILEAGAAYLPIDPKFPKERLWYLLENSGAQVVLTQSRLEEKLEWPANVIRFCVDAEIIAGRTESEPPRNRRAPDDLAYVLYTSGSTGKPKGVMIAHCGVVNCIVETNRSFGINENDRALAVTALHHDMSVYDIFGLLGAGGAIVIPDASGSRAPDHWVELIDQHNVTIWNSVPGFMEMLLDYAAGQDLELKSSLRLAFLGGDWIPLSAPQRIKKHFGNMQVVSVGGPTETTVWNIWYPIVNVDSTWRSIPYGQAIANTRYYIVDENLQDCAPGVAGEMCCAGVGLMKGYWGDPEQTRTRLTVHPRTGEQIYRTGDRGLLREDGEIEFLGRIDSQVKVNGQRIELGEIEAELIRYPGVKQAAVNAVPYGEQKRLVGYVVTEAGKKVEAFELRSFLEKALPQYMIPFTFVALSSLPLNANGKVDRNALPIPADSAHSQSIPRAGKVLENIPLQPRTKQNDNLQEIITNVWRKVLSVEQIGMDDNFFDLGADSLLLVQAHSDLQRQLHRTIAVTDLFEFPSVRALRRHLENGKTAPLAISEIQHRANRQRAALARQRVASK
jgi:pyochelin synthetase